MTPNKRRGLVMSVLISMLVLGIASRLHRPLPRARPPARPAAPAAEFVHPVIPSTPVIHPAPAGCQPRDLHALTAAVRQTEQKAAPPRRAPENGASATCRADPANRMPAAMADLYNRSASACVARDAALDSQWNQVQSAILALGDCLDCAKPRSAREKSCARATELANAADKATPAQ